jgi:hypothetical protein
MAEKPILFSGPMVRAILEGRKTQTRRVLKPQPRSPALSDGYWYDADAPGRFDDGERAIVAYLSGQRLWVREAWRVYCEFDRMPPRDIPTGSHIQYIADNPISPWLSRYRPPMFMPRWASRITLEVSDVKVERLQDISEADAIAEGALLPWTGSPGTACDDTRDARSEFAALWNSINGHGAWDDNPWVAAYSFRRIKP